MMNKDKPMDVVCMIAAVLVIIGGINWGLVGAFNFELVSYIFGTMSTISRIIYCVIGIAALYMAYGLIVCGMKGDSKSKSES